MRVVIFGAGGKTGSHLVEQALERGYEVMAFSYHIVDAFPDSDRLEVFEGDAMDENAVKLATTGADAIISALGHGTDTPANMQAKSMRNIISACRSHGIKRLISLTGSGVRDPGDKPGFLDKTLNLAIFILLRRIIQDGVEHARLIQESDLDWVIVRATRLTNGPKTGDYSVGLVRKGVRYRVSRADVADFMLNQLEDDTYLRQMPYISH